MHCSKRISGTDRHPKPGAVALGMVSVLFDTHT
jgi:hypothetical protein